LAKNAKATREVVAIAEKLYDQLFPVAEVGESGDEPPINGDFPVPSDEPPKGDSESGDGEPDGEGDGEPSDPKEPLKDDGTAPLEVEPNEFIKRSMREFDCRADRRGYGRPAVKKVEIINIENWS
jgi:hypothetical protein